MRKKFMFFLGTVLVLVLAISAYSLAVTKSLTINALVTTRGTLTLSVTAINFPAADPDVVASIPATENPVTVTGKAQNGGTTSVTLTCMASGDLVSGTDIILIPNVTWTATGAGFVAGTMSKTVQVNVASWVSSGNRTGTLSFFLANSWAYPTGSYTQVVVYTLTAV